jgi:hypothetical protein
MEPLFLMGMLSLAGNGDVGSRSDPRNQNDSSIQALLPETE